MPVTMEEPGAKAGTPLAETQVGKPLGVSTRHSAL